MASEDGFPSILNLNVGGFVYTTTLNTITRDPNSMLGTMFSGRQKVAKDSKGNYFIDRDGSLFRHVLNFLRSWELRLPQSFDEFEQLSAEADFYQVGDLIKALQIRREDRRRNPPPSDGLGVITIIEYESNQLLLSGRGELIAEVFEGSLNTTAGYMYNIEISILKANAFDLLNRHGFQLEGCNGGGSGAVLFHEYIFVRKNKL